MKFHEFNLYSAIHDVYLEFEKTSRKPRSDDWLIYQSKRHELCSLINGKILSLPAALRADEAEPSHERILKAWDDFGKNKEKYKLIISVANKFGRQCFYANRNRGRCSDIVRVESIAHSDDPTAVENCMIVCKKHSLDR